MPDHLEKKKMRGGGTIRRLPLRKLQLRGGGTVRKKSYRGGGTVSGVATVKDLDKGDIQTVKVLSLQEGGTVEAISANIQAAGRQGALTEPASAIGTGTIKRAAQSPVSFGSNLTSAFGGVGFLVGGPAGAAIGVGVGAGIGLIGDGISAFLQWGASKKQLEEDRRVEALNMSLLQDRNRRDDAIIKMNARERAQAREDTLKLDRMNRMTSFLDGFTATLNRRPQLAANMIALAKGRS